MLNAVVVNNEYKYLEIKVYAFFPHNVNILEDFSFFMKACDSPGFGTT